LSFADILKHLVDADKWITAILNDDKTFPRADIHPGEVKDLGVMGMAKFLCGVI
jgi:hypothetical protein